MWGYPVDPRVVERLKMGDYSFGCAGTHLGIGTVECPWAEHHHHDEFCHLPTVKELEAAGIDPKTFKSTSRR